MTSYRVFFAQILNKDHYPSNSRTICCWMPAFLTHSHMLIHVRHLRCKRVLFEPTPYEVTSILWYLWITYINLQHSSLQAWRRLSRHTVRNLLLPSSRQSQFFDYPVDKARNILIKVGALHQSIRRQNTQSWNLHQQSSESLNPSFISVNFVPVQSLHLFPPTDFADDRVRIPVRTVDTIRLTVVVKCRKNLSFKLETGRRHNMSSPATKYF